jgi:radical SAM-linked protein
MNDQAPIHYRMRFAKTAAMRFTSHLDLYRTWERTMRRAGVPLAYSHGYNPRPRISLGDALPLGFTSDCEMVDFWLEEPREPEALVTQLRQALPPGLRVHEVKRVHERKPALQQRIVASEYEVVLDPEPGAQELEARVRGLLEAEALPRSRRGKEYDLRPLVEELEVQGADSGVRLRMRLSAREGATGRPDEVLLQMGYDPATARIHRTRLFLEEG